MFCDGTDRRSKFIVLLFKSPKQVLLYTHYHWFQQQPFHHSVYSVIQYFVYQFLHYIFIRARIILQKYKKIHIIPRYFELSKSSAL